MPNNVYAEINLHIIWHTKYNVPVINQLIEDRLQHFLHHRIIETPEVLFHAIGGTPDHIHLAVSIPPTVHISQWIGELKGASGYYINNKIANSKLLEWQHGYGVVSFGRKDLPWVVRYIHNQKQHHAQGRIEQRLEKIEMVAN